MYWNPLETLEPPAFWPQANQSDVVPPESANFSAAPYRWWAYMPTWQRYAKPGDYPYVKSHWYDPFNRNRIKGDEPIFGQTGFWI